ncbi:MAG TPA: hypothetical protein VK536_02840 [Candidatus Limnocylindrales bacterium]|nr:hypothetical protein [Candidatus Limnocylindrales bacterium]
MPYTENLSAKILSLIIILALAVTPLLMVQAFNTQITNTPEYTNYVSSYVNAHGNFTYVQKPMFPVLITNSQILIGGNWTIICPLQANHNYHIYFFGSYVNTSVEAKTDYDVYVYGPQGNLESSHLESAGFPPHLGTTIGDPLFTPTQSGNYSFVIVNNRFGSQGAQEGTFMIIENLETDKWCTAYLEGTGDSSSSSNSSSNFYTSWAYEFVTNASKIQVYINVPSTLDVYEARLYLMDNDNYQTLDSFPLPWEPGLYGNVNGSVGGYNFDPNGYRGVAYASDEYSGQTLVLNYTSPNTGLNLYHLVLIGGEGSGNVELMMKTNFAVETLTPLTIPSKVYPGNSTEIAYTTNSTELSSAQLSYTSDNWNSSDTMDMQVSNQTCSAAIPSQKVGSLVQYKIAATDVLENSLEAQGNYTVKDPATLNITVAKNEIVLGQNIAVTGTLTPSFNDSKVTVEFATANSAKIVNCTVDSKGVFVASWKPNASGLWAVMASSQATPLTYSGYSQELTVKVNPPPLYVKYSLYLIIGFVALVAVGGVVYFLRSRRG